MKITIQKFFLLLFLIVEAGSMMASAKCNGFLTSDDDGNITMLKPKVTVTFTIARRRDCEGFGICNWTTSISSDRIRNVTGTMTIDEASRNVLIIEIPKATGITAASYDKYFRGGTFLMEDDSAVPSEILKALGLSGSKTLLAGRHPIVESNGILSITIPVK